MRVIVFAIFFLGAGSCKDQADCEEKAAEHVVLSFFQQQGMPQNPVLSRFDAIFLVEERAPQAHLLYTHQDFLAAFSLAIPPDGGLGTYRFCTADTCKEIQLFFTKEMHIISPDCGAQVAYRIQRVVHHDYHALSFFPDILTRSENAHVEVYLSE